MSSMLDKLLDINQLEAGIVRPAIVDFPIKRLLDELRTEFTYHAATERPRLARGPEQPHRAQRSASSRADHPQSAVERGEVHHQGQAPARLPTPRRQAPHRGLGHRPRHPGTGAPGDLRGIPSARQSRARTKQGPRSRSRHRAAPCRPARAQDRRPLASGRGLGLHHRGAARTSRGGGPAGSEPERDAGEHAVPRHDPDRRRRSGGARNAPAALRRRGSSHRGRRRWAQGAGVGSARVDRAGPRHRRLQPAEGPQRARDHRQAAEAAPARNPGHHPDRRHLDR